MKNQRLFLDQFEAMEFNFYVVQEFLPETSPEFHFGLIWDLIDAKCQSTKMCYYLPSSDDRVLEDYLTFFQNLLIFAYSNRAEKIVNIASRFITKIQNIIKQKQKQNGKVTCNC